MTVPISELIGKTLTDIQKSDDVIMFICDDGDVYQMRHDQACCESVSIDDICGDLNDLIGYTIIKAEELVSNEPTLKQVAEKEKEKFEQGEDYWESDESFTWTFYKFATAKGYVDIKWFGTSNGYYSESVSLIKADKN